MCGFPLCCRVETQGLRRVATAAGAVAGSGGGAAAGGVWDWRRVQQQLLQLHLTTPGLQLRLLNKQEEAAAHIIHTARVSEYCGSVVGQQGA